MVKLINKGKVETEIKVRLESVIVTAYIICTR